MKVSHKFIKTYKLRCFGCFTIIFTTLLLTLPTFGQQKYRDRFGNSKYVYVDAFSGGGDFSEDGIYGHFTVFQFGYHWPKPIGLEVALVDVVRYKENAGISSIIPFGVYLPVLTFDLPGENVGLLNLSARAHLIPQYNYTPRDSENNPIEEDSARFPPFFDICLEWRGPAHTISLGYRYQTRPFGYDVAGWPRDLDMSGVFANIRVGLSMVLAVSPRDSETARLRASPTYGGSPFPREHKTLFSRETLDALKRDRETLEELNRELERLKQQGRYAEGIKTARKYLQKAQETHTSYHPRNCLGLKVAGALTWLAFFNDKQGKYTEGESLNKRVLEIFEKAYGSDNPSVATILNNLAGSYYSQGKYSQAVPLYKRALKVFEKAYGPNHPDVVTVLNSLALLEVVSDRPEAALPLMRRSLLIDEHTIDNVFSLASEREKLTFLSTVAYNFEALQSLVAQELATDSEAVHTALDAALRRKGLVLDALLRERMALLASGDPQVAEVARQLQDAVSHLAGLTLAGPEKLSSEVYKSRLAELEEEKERLEKELASLSGAYKAEKQSQRVNAEHVARALEPGSALVEYVGYRVFDFHAKGTEKKWKEHRYLAFVLPAGQEANPTLVDLGEAEDIDKAVRDFRGEMANAGEVISRAGEAEAERQLAEKGKHIYELVFAPLKAAIGDSTVLYVAPDGELNLIAFGALPDENGSYLAETYQFNYLSSGRDLMRFAPKAASSTGAVVVADPDYNSSGAEVIPQPRGESPLLAMRGAARSMDLKQVEWPSLPGTRREAEAIMKELSGEQVQLYLGDQASEEVVKGVQAPRILHLATHGFFLEEQDKPEPQEGMDGFRSVELVGVPFRPTPAAMDIENPLLRSGLVFAGANHLGEGVLPDGADDGILTALEVSGMSLWGTDLVVLSACETAVGEARYGEGVFGLRRAFQLAGARTIVMSQWEIPDDETVTLMTDFYSRWQSGSGKSQALREASLSLMRKRRKEHGAAHPYYWGAFVCVGQP